MKIRLIDLRLISQNPVFSTRQVADEVGISSNSVCNVRVTLFEKGIFKLSDFKKKPHKDQYAYLLTPKGILKKSLLTDNFIKQKRDDLGVLRAEIKTLKEEFGPTAEARSSPRVSTR